MKKNVKSLYEKLGGTYRLENRHFSPYVPIFETDNL